jgi:hypothetical protein
LFHVEQFSNEEENMAETYTVTPHIIERWVIADEVEVAGITEPSGRALLVFASEEKAEGFRTQTGLYPASEGCEVVAVDLDGVRNLIRTLGYETVALCGLEADGGADVFDAEAFCEMLEDSLR